MPLEFFELRPASWTEILLAFWSLSNHSGPRVCNKYYLRTSELGKKIKNLVRNTGWRARTSDFCLDPSGTPSGYVLAVTSQNLGAVTQKLQWQKPIEWLWRFQTCPASYRYEGTSTGGQAPVHLHSYFSLYFWALSASMLLINWMYRCGFAFCFGFRTL